MNFRDLSLEDISRKLANTVFWDKANDRSYYIGDVGGSSSRPLSLFTEVKGTNSYTNESTGRNFLQDIDVAFPQLGFINFTRSNGDISYVSFLYRKIRRQYRYGVNNDVVGAGAGLLPAYRAIGKSARFTLQHGFSPNTMRDIFQPKYLSFNEAKELVSSRQHVAVAISPEFCIANSLHADVPIIYYLQQAVGAITADGQPVLFPPGEYLKAVFPFDDVSIIEDEPSVKNILIRN